jgi:hypothetical protein
LSFEGNHFFSENFVETFVCDCASNGQQIYSSLREPNADITIFLHVTTVESDTLSAEDFQRIYRLFHNCFEELCHILSACPEMQVRSPEFGGPERVSFL